MADVDEDAPLSGPHGVVNHEDNDPSDELPDFRLLAALTTSADEKHRIPKRGEKDFESHGTKHQEAILEASRQAMHDALGYTRVHPPKSNCRAWYFGDGALDDDDDEDGPLSEAIRGKGLDRDHIVMVESSRGAHFRTMGKTALGTAEGKLWLLPEEALYLVERGNLDLWWPARPMNAVRGQVRGQGTWESLGNDEDDDGLPLSLQAAYSLLVGEDGEKGKVSLDRYTVYANLKRTGYVVFRVRQQEDANDQLRESPRLEDQRSSQSLFTQLFGALFSTKPPEQPPCGPLIQPGLYRSYNQIYRQLSVIPRHEPSPRPTHSSTAAGDDPRLVFRLWKPSRIPTFAKSNPGRPDFHVAIVSSRATGVPVLGQLVSLLESTPWDPPPPEWTGPEKTYQRLKHGYRNVVLAVVDQGIISYLKMSEAAFGEEKLHARFDRSSSNNHRGGKRGGSRGRGRGARGQGR